MQLNEICAAIVDCEHKTAPAGDEYALLVGTRAMKDGRLVIDACKPVSERTYVGWSQRIVPVEGDLVLAREAPVGQVIRVPSMPRICLGQRTVLIRPDSKRVHPRFLHYWLLGPDAQGTMVAQAAGATVAHLNVEDIRRLDVSKLPPDRKHQRAAAESLGAIDDLIENNRRRVEVLEEMARAIYREWFVHFRYPGHENATFAASPHGTVPEGWLRVPLVSAARITMGQSPSSEYYNLDGVGTPFHQGVTDFGVHFPRHRKYCTVAGRTAADGDVLVSVRAPVGRLNLADETLVIGRGLAAVQALDGRQGLLFAQLKEVFAEEDSMGGGTIFKAIGKAELQQVQVLRAPDELAEHGNQVLSPKFDLIRALTMTNRRLAHMRDLLLPKLTTGQIDVSSLDVDALAEDSVA